MRQWKITGSASLRDAWISICPETKEEVSHWRLEEIVEKIRTGSVITLDYRGQPRTYDIKEIQANARALYHAGCEEARELNDIQIGQLLAEMKLDAAPEDVKPTIARPLKNRKEFFITKIESQGQVYPTPEGFRYHRPQDMGKDRARRVKETMPAAIFQGVFQPKRNAACMVRHDGIYLLDLDDVEDLAAVEKRVQTDPSVFMDFVSVSGSGLKVGVLGPVVKTAAAYTRIYTQIVKLKGAAWGATASVDTTTSDCSRLCYFADDPDIYVNWDARPVTQDELAVTASEPVEPEPARPPQTASTHEPQPRRTPTRTTTSHVSHNGPLEPLAIDWSQAGPVPDLEWKDKRGEPLPLARVLDALRYVDPVDRESWRKSGAALRLAYGDDVFPFWDLWSSQAGDVYGGTEDSQNTWDSHSREEGENVATPLYILKLAYEKGWRGTRERPRSRQYYAEQAQQEAKEERESHSIIELVSRFESQILPTLCVGDQWYSLTKSGLWKQYDIEWYQPLCMNVMPVTLRTARRCDEVLRTFQRINQVPRSKFQPACTWPPGDRDRDVCMVNCRNGLLLVGSKGVDLEKPSKHFDPNAICFGSQVMAAYNPEAECPCFDALIEYAFEHNEQRLELLRWFLGYCLYPDLAYRLALVNYGETTTGKSTLWEFGVGGVVGPATMVNLPLEVLCDEKGYSLPRLQNALLNVGGELDAQELVLSSRFKQIVGGEGIEVRAIYGKPFTMTGYICKHVFLSNQLPVFKHGTAAELERLKFLPWGRRIENQDVSIPIKIRTERDGIFSRWMVPALQRLLGGWKCPDDDKDVRELFAITNDPVEQFILACCVLDPNARTAKAEVWGAFKVWARQNDVATGIQVKDVFGKYLFRHLIGKVKRGKINPEGRHGSRIEAYVGLVLKPEVQAEASRASHEID